MDVYSFVTPSHLANYLQAGGARENDYGGWFGFPDLSHNLFVRKKKLSPSFPLENNRVSGIKKQPLAAAFGQARALFDQHVYVRRQPT
jgi:hypothetical protein